MNAKISIKLLALLKFS